MQGLFLTPISTRGSKTTNQVGTPARSVQIISYKAQSSTDAHPNSFMLRLRASASSTRLRSLSDFREIRHGERPLYRSCTSMCRASPAEDNHTCSLVVSLVRNVASPSPPPLSSPGFLLSRLACRHLAA